MSDKSNIQHLRDIIKKLQDDKIGEAARNDLFEEAIEFLGAIEEKAEESINDKERIKELEDDITGLESDEPDWDTVELGLDTFYYSLGKGNLAIQQEVESFVNRLKKKYIGVSAS